MKETGQEHDRVFKFEVVDGCFTYQAKRKNAAGETESYSKPFTNFAAHIDEVHRIDTDFVNSERILVTIEADNASVAK